MPKNRNPSPRHFWAYDETPEGEPAVLRLEGPIADESWWGDEVTPAAFRAELEAHPGDIVVYINSPGGDVVAGSQIYTMLMEHKGSVTVKIDGIAASAASVIAMAGSTVLMAPTAYMMIHNVWSIAIGNKHEMEHEAALLDEFDKGIREAYHIKTGIRDGRLSEMMDDETWMSARTCIELGFADGYIGAAPEEPEEPEEEPDEEEEPDGIGRAAIGRFPAVAYSGHRQAAALWRLLRGEGASGRTDHESRKTPPEGDASGDPKRADALDATAMAKAATQRLKLQLLSL